MESILARALEYTLKYWLKSFTRDQFKLQGRTAQLSNLDINGEALHASMGLPPALSVTTAKVGKLEIMLPYVSNVQTEPIVVQIDRIDLVLKENPDADVNKGPSSAQSPTGSAKSSGYGFADKIADGMTLQVKVVNLLLETRGGAHREGGAAWAAPLASITIRNLVLYTTNESWKVVNLKEARDFSTNTGFIYLFKKLEWEALSIDLLPHPDMFTEANLARSEEGNLRDDDGAKRVFFGGERFLEGISGQAYITVQRTELNNPLGLEVQLHVTEAVCPALSEPGLRALLRFLTGLYVCLNRGDVDPKSQQHSTEAAGRSLVSIVVDHVFLCIKDAEFQLELLMQSLLFSRACVSDGETANYLTKVMIGGLFLRDAFSRSPCALVQPSMQAIDEDFQATPEFSKDFCPPIYPLGSQQWQLIHDVPLISLYSLQVKPSPKPPRFASKTEIHCQPLMIHLQEEACLRISSFLADGIVVNPGDILPDFSVNSLLFTLKELDVSVPLDMSNLEDTAICEDLSVKKYFSGARLHIENLSFSESPTLKLRLLNLEKDPVCFCLWAGQPIDASQKKWRSGASHFSLALETHASQRSPALESGLWRCVEAKDVSVEVAMVSADGKPLQTIPPPGGIVRVGVACEQYISNASVEQLFFVLDLYAYFGKVSEKISIVKESKRQNRAAHLTGGLMEKVPCDTAVILALKDLQLRFLEYSCTTIQEMPLVQFLGKDLSIKVTHRTLGGAIAVSSNLYWENVEVDCVETEGKSADDNGSNGPSAVSNGCTQLRPVFWVVNRRNRGPGGSTLLSPFLDISMTHVIPLSEKDRECHSLSIVACISSVRLGGGMSYAEALLHRFGILGVDGGPGEGLSKGLKHLSAGPLSKLFKASIVDDLKQDGSSGNWNGGGFSHLGAPDDIDVSVELRDWLFALEGSEEVAERWFNNNEDIRREERCWHTTFQNFRVIAKSTPKKADINGTGNLHAVRKYPVDSVVVGVEGLQTLKPQMQKGTMNTCSGLPTNGVHESDQTSGGINVEAHIVASGEDRDDDALNWVAESLKFSVKQPVEAIVTKDELQHLMSLCKSEVDAMGRIVAGVIRVLKLEDSVGQAALNRLSNLGSEGFDKIFSPDQSRVSTPKSLMSAASPDPVRETSRTQLESTVTSLEEAAMELEAKCSSLVSDFTDSESSSKHIDELELLNQKLQSMKSLVAKLRTQI